MGLLLFKRDTDESEFVREAQRFLSAIRSGKSETDAALRARTSTQQVRTWMREPAFQQAYRRAREGKPRARVINLNTIHERDQELALLKRRRDAGQLLPGDAARLNELEAGAA